jgi:hypothetical protein
LAEATAPAHVVRTMASTGTGPASPRITTGDGSSIVYDRTERRFVNAVKQQPATQGIPGIRVSPAESRSGSATSQVPAASDRVTGREGQVVPSARTVAPPRATVPPPSVPRSVTSERAFNGFGGGGGSARGGASSAGVSSSRAGSSASVSQSGARASGGSAGGGGRAH